MRKRFGLLAASTLLFGAQDPSLPGAKIWRQYGYAAAHTSFDDAETRLTRDNVSRLMPVWSGSIGAEPGSAVVVGRRSVFVASGGRVEALNAGNGVRRWGHLSCSGQGTVQPALGPRVLLVGDGGGDLAAYDSATGDQLWCDDESGSIRSAPALSGAMAFVTNGGDAIALDPLTGIQVWRFTPLDFNPLTSTPAVSRGRVYVTGGSAVFALDERDGRLLWRRDLVFQANLSAAAVSDGSVFVGGTALYALDETNGALLWENDGVGMNVSTPAIAAGKVYVNSQDANFGLWAFDARNGSLLWRSILPGESMATVAVANGVVYDLAETGELMMFDADTGTFLSSVVDPEGRPFASGAGAQPAIVKGTVLAPTGDPFAPNAVDAFRLP